MRKIIPVTLLLLSLLLIACGGGEAELPGDSSRGKELYEQATIGSAGAPGCANCHSLEPDVTIIGPSYAGIATRAGTAVPGKSAAEFLRESIIDPDAVMTEGFPAGVMYPKYGSDLSEEDIDDLVAFLMTLK